MPAGAVLSQTVVLGALTILENGSDKQKAVYLPEIVAGKMIMTMALNEADGCMKQAR